MSAKTRKLARALAIALSGVGAVRRDVHAVPVVAATRVSRTAARRAASWGLSERELAKCAEKGIDPAAYARTKAAIAALSARPNTRRT